jgi:GLPGLI family protein
MIRGEHCFPLSLSLPGKTTKKPTMKKYWFIMMILLANCNFSASQEIYSGKAEYIVELKLDKNSDLGSRRFSSVLLFNQNETFYYENSETEIQETSDGLSVFMNLSGKEKHSVYKNYVQNEMISSESILTKHFRVYDSIPQIKWELLSGRKQIADLECRKATGHFRGRDYNAWYFPDVPLRIGPWKLGGLPGIIMEINDTEKEVSFTITALSFQLSPKELDLIQPVKKGKSIDFEDFFDLQYQKAEELKDFLTSTGNYDDVDISSQVFSIEKTKR